LHLISILNQAQTVKLFLACASRNFIALYAKARKFDKLYLAISKYHKEDFDKKHLLVASCTGTSFFSLAFTFCLIKM